MLEAAGYKLCLNLFVERGSHCLCVSRSVAPFESRPPSSIDLGSYRFRVVRRGGVKKLSIADQMRVIQVFNPRSVRECTCREQGWTMPVGIGRRASARGSHQVRRVNPRTALYGSVRAVNVGGYLLGPTRCAGYGCKGMAFTCDFGSMASKSSSVVFPWGLCCLCQFILIVT